MQSHMKRFTGQVWKETECESFCPCGVGVCHLPGTWMWSSVQKHSESCMLGIFMEASSSGCVV